MKSYPRIWQKLFASPLMLHAPARQAFERVLLARMSGDETVISSASINARSPQASERIRPAAGRADVGEPGEPMHDWIGFEQDYAATKKQLRISNIYNVYGDVAVVQIHGVIDKMISQFEMDCYGGCDLADVDQALSLAASNPNVSRVVLDIDSPGGSVIGVADTATRIAALRETKEVHAFIPAMACSAGYYLASQADVISAAQSAIVGSIGVYCAILDASKYYEEEGLQMQFIKAGNFKTMGTDWRPLTPEETALLQQGVDANYAAFKAACTSLREIDDSTMQGQWFDAATGYELNLVDELTGATLDEYVSALLLS
ncbi:S49 family peptidase [Prosthecobacter sp.]|uniref:S49 family peptidase n=1 Tax=Prosthecobacter sp. TaxID=1965333 RepID=UPI003784824E